jgi:hypothetical protein
MMNNNFMLAALAQSAALLVSKMQARLTPGQYPQAIKDSITQTAPRQDRGGYSVEVHVGGSSAPMAFAFEYGSGLHATRKPAEKYRIAPRPNGPGYLAFPTSRWPNYSPPPNVNVARFPGAISNKGFVMHPGIVARPFVGPSVDDSRAEVRAILGRGFKATIMAGVKPVTVIEVK